MNSHQPDMSRTFGATAVSYRRFVSSKIDSHIRANLRPHPAQIDSSNGQEQGINTPWILMNNQYSSKSCLAAVFRAEKLKPRRATPPMCQDVT